MNNNLISHNFASDARSAIDELMQEIDKRGDLPEASVKEQKEIVLQLNEFPFGQFLLANKGVNGFWTDYMLTHPWRIKETPHLELTELERFVLQESPLMLATQERFLFFLNENQKQVKEGAHLACLPCGKMGELLYLDYSSINNIQLTGFDIDEKAILDAKTLATDKGLIKHTSFQCQNAWSLSEKNVFDLISCNGLNIYEPSDKKVTKLYTLFFDALVPGGHLVTSFITPPDEWLLDKINVEHAKKEKLIFADILQSKWRSYRSEEKTNQQLLDAGFRDINFIYDEAHIFPTVTAIKGG